MAFKPKPGLIPTFRDPYNLLRDFDRQTARAGGIQRITAARSSRGRIEVSIEGLILPPLYRGHGLPQPGQIKAPEYNKMFVNLQNMADLNERVPGIGSCQLAHSWGPGFGDEAAAGMMWANQDVNLKTQPAIERFLREYAEEAAHVGLGVWLKTTAVSWDWKDNFADFLHFAEYEVSKIGDRIGYDAFTATIEAPAPGVPGSGTFDVEKKEG